MDIDILLILNCIIYIHGFEKDDVKEKFVGKSIYEISLFARTDSQNGTRTGGCNQWANCRPLERGALFADCRRIGEQKKAERWIANIII